MQPRDMIPVPQQRAGSDTVLSDDSSETVELSSLCSLWLEEQETQLRTARENATEALETHGNVPWEGRKPPPPHGAKHNHL